MLHTETEFLHRLVILTNVPTPYRTPFFNTLHSVLAEHSIELFVLYCAEREPHRKWKINFDEQYFQWRLLPGIHPKFRGWYPHVNPVIVQVLQELRPTWVMIAGAWNTPTMLLGLYSCKKYVVPTIFWSEGHEDAVLHPKGVIALFRRKVFELFDGFAVPNSRSMRFVYNQVPSSVRIIKLPNTIDENFFMSARNNDQKENIRRQFGIPQNKIVIVAVAQLEERKGIMELIEAFGLLPLSDQERVFIALVGDGSMLNSIEEKITLNELHSIKLIGHLERDKVRDILSASDAFILPTKRDPNPLTVIEASFLGLPLIISNKAGNVDELVIDGWNGHVIEQISAQNIAISLRRFLSNDQMTRETMGSRSFDIVHKDFTRHEVARNFVEQLVVAFPVK